MKIILFMLLSASLVWGEELSSDRVAKMVLSEIKSKKITHMGLIIKPFQRDEGRLSFKTKDIERVEINLNLLKSMSVQPAKNYRKGELDYFVIAYDKGNPIYALYYNGRSQEGGFSLYFCKQLKERFLIGGRVLITKSSMDDKGRRVERPLILYISQWEKSRINRALRKARGGSVRE